MLEEALWPSLPSFTFLVLGHLLLAPRKGKLGGDHEGRWLCVTFGTTEVRIVYVQACLATSSTPIPAFRVNEVSSGVDVFKTSIVWGLA